MVIVMCCSCLRRSPKHYNFCTRNWPRLGLLLTACLLAAAGILGIVSGLPITFLNEESMDIAIDTSGRILNDTNAIESSLAWLNHTELLDEDLRDFMVELNETYVYAQAHRHEVIKEQYEGLMVLVSVFAVGLFISITSCFTSVWSHKLSVFCLAFLIVLLYPVVWLGLAGGLPVGVFTADMCQDIHPFLMNQTQNNNTRTMINYYLECQGENPFGELVTASTQILQYFDEELNKTIANNGSQSEIDEIKANIAQLGVLSTALVDVTNCEVVHTPWQHVQTNVCIDML